MTDLKRADFTPEEIMILEAAKKVLQVTDLGDDKDIILKSLTNEHKKILQDPVLVEQISLYKNVAEIYNKFIREAKESFNAADYNVGKIEEGKARATIDESNKNDVIIRISVIKLSLVDELRNRIDYLLKCKTPPQSAFGAPAAAAAASSLSARSAGVGAGAGAGVASESTDSEATVSRLDLNELINDLQSECDNYIAKGYVVGGSDFTTRCKWAMAELTKHYLNKVREAGIHNGTQFKLYLYAIKTLESKLKDYNEKQASNGKRFREMYQAMDSYLQQFAKKLGVNKATPPPATIDSFFSSVEASTAAPAATSSSFSPSKPASSVPRAYTEAPKSSITGSGAAALTGSINGPLGEAASASSSVTAKGVAAVSGQADSKAAASASSAKPKSSGIFSFISGTFGTSSKPLSGRTRKDKEQPLSTIAELNESLLSSPPPAVAAATSLRAFPTAAQKDNSAVAASSTSFASLATEGRARPQVSSAAAASASLETAHLAASENAAGLATSPKPESANAPAVPTVAVTLSSSRALPDRRVSSDESVLTDRRASRDGAEVAI